MFKKKIIVKTIEQPNKKLSFRFIGTENNSNIDYEELNRILEKYFNYNTKTDDIYQIISWIRTILKDFDEEYLILEIANETTEEKVIYVNKVLTKYIKKDKEHISLNYDINKDQNLSISLPSININHYSSYKQKEEEISKNLNQLYKLTNIIPVELTSFESALCLFYKNFYNEYPDFFDKDINIKMQSMMNILTTFGVIIDENIDFKLNSKKFPVSIELSKIITRLKPLGKVEHIPSYVQLTKEVENYIKVIGKNIMDYVKKTDNEIETLKKISRIFYSGEYCVPTDAAINTIAHSYNYTKEEVTESFKLKKTINTEIRNYNI